MIQIASELEPILILGVLTCDEVRVADRSEDLEQALVRAEEKVRVSPPAESALVRTMYHRLGLDPTRTRPSSEALLRRVRRGDSLPADQHPRGYLQLVLARAAGAVRSRTIAPTSTARSSSVSDGPVRSTQAFARTSCISPAG